MKKVWAVVMGAVAILCSALFFGCNSELSGGKGCGTEGYGSLTVLNTGRAISVSSITNAKIVVTGNGIAKGSEPYAVSEVSNGKNTSGITVYDIPAGKNRIISVYAYDNDSKLDENQIVLRTVTDIKPGSNTIDVINKSSTALGNVFFYLDELGYNVSSVSSQDKTAISDVIDSTKGFLQINSAAIAVDYMNGGAAGLKEKALYVNGAILGGNSDIVLYAKGYKSIHYWDDGKSGTTADMEPASSKGEGWYTYSFTNKEKINFLFKPNSGEDWAGKTADFSRTPGVWYYENGAWTGSSVMDTQSPAAVLLSPCDGAVLSGDVYFILDAQDDSGIKAVEFYVDDQLAASTEGSFSYVFDSSNLSNGTHTVYAKVFDGENNDATTLKITVTANNAEKKPVAVLSEKKTCTATIKTTFDGSGSKGSVASYSWDFGDGSTGSGATVSHTYNAEGTYTVKLTVKSAGGLTDCASCVVTVNKKGSFEHRDFREETVYFMMTDRFADGDKTNNNIWGDEYLPGGESQMYDYSEDKTGILSYYHGGDFKGIIDNLDYIKDMGFTAIWITPSVKQPEGRYFYDGSNGGDPYQASAFHGYWGYDFDKIDPHLHSSGKDSDGWDDYRAFIDACHAKEIRVMQDIVLNHGNHTAATAPTKWAGYSVQTIMDGKEWAWKTLDPYYEPVAEGATPSKNGFYSYYGFGQCADLIDFGHLGEDGKDSRHHLINVYKKFIDAGVDAFRIDTMAYIPNEFAGEFADAMYNYAKELGNDYFYMVGEAWCGRYDAVARHSMDKTDSLHMLDMQLSCLDYPGEMYKVFGGQDAIGSVYNNVTGADKDFACMTPDEYTKTAMFVDNHDCYRCNGRFSEAQYKNALNYIYLFRGVPIVYYGTEACYSWKGAHSSSNKEDVVARWMLGDEGINYVKTKQPAMYKHLKVLNELYHASECIQKGEQDNVSIGQIPAAFTRTWNNKTAYVVLNHQGAEGSYSFSNVKSGSYTLYTSDGNGTLNKAVVTAGGSYTVKAPANGFAVLDPAD